MLKSTSSIFYFCFYFWHKQLTFRYFLNSYGSLDIYCGAVTVYFLYRFFIVSFVFELEPSYISNFLIITLISDTSMYGVIFIDETSKAFCLFMWVQLSLYFTESKLFHEGFLLKIWPNPLDMYDPKICSCLKKKYKMLVGTCLCRKEVFFKWW